MVKETATEVYLIMFQLIAPGVNGDRGEHVLRRVVVVIGLAQEQGMGQKMGVINAQEFHLIQHVATQIPAQVRTNNNT